jgi:hypothetical protein
VRPRLGGTGLAAAAGDNGMKGIEPPALS